MFADDEAHKDSNCAVLFVLSHGGSNAANSSYVLGSDGKRVFISDLLDLMNESSTLDGKPKLVFIQACRGSRLNKWPTLKFR